MSRQTNKLFFVINIISFFKIIGFTIEVIVFLYSILPVSIFKIYKFGSDETTILFLYITIGFE